MLKPLTQRLLDRLLASPWMRQAMWRHARDLFAGPRQGPTVTLPTYEVSPARYALGQAPGATGGDKAPPIFITARFRSGSTLLWNLFRHLPGYTAYYEPLNERGWFRAENENRNTDSSHLGVADYAAEYKGLSALESMFSENWAYRQLFMDEADPAPDLYRYISTLIVRAPERPVLQFNRVDFRLRWLRSRFPNARLLHLYRCPRDQWVSALRGGRAIDQAARLDGFADHDRFYLLPWLQDLATVYPCLNLPGDWHPYAGHYLLWRLSWLHARQYADASIAYEALVGDLAGSLAALAGPLELGPFDPAPLQELIQGDTTPRWPRYAEATWFEGIEAECEALLAGYLKPPATRCPTITLD
jgi:hypothetical protein